jgi:ribosomal protein L11 methyltransferase
MPRPSAHRGVDLSPYWRVVADEGDAPRVAPEGEPRVLRIPPGASFGDGRHETTQLCLLALGSLARTGAPMGTVLDFGAGSGVLAIAAALAGARVEAVEIDARALVEAGDNARRNGVEARVELRDRLREPAAPFDVVVANILRGVLLDAAPALAARQSRAGHMILSGLVATDVPAILARYRPLLAPMRDEVYARGEWRAVMFAPARG